ncbi:PVC-type heme-binding CxxCH protein [Sediminicola luteus]|nr:PVC-type heme-binding CxxCH protein [Sediminicola luteus]
MASLVVLVIGCGGKDKGLKEAFEKNQEVAAERRTHSFRTAALSPKEQLATFSVPEGFVVELVASEEDGVVNPIDMTFDDAGRLWTQTAEMYPMDPVADIKWHELLKLMNNPKAQRQNPSFRKNFDLYEGKTKGTDKIVVLSDFYGNSKVKSKVWANGLAIPQSILPYKSGAYVAQGSELFFLDDSDNDGKADKRTRLFTGFGITDTHTMAHLLIRAPGNWVNFSHGALNKGAVHSLISGDSVRIDFSKNARFSLDGAKIELVNSGLNNIWGYSLLNTGEWYGTEANDLGYSINPMESQSGFPGIGNERFRDYQPWLPKLHDFRVGGTGISGLAFMGDTSGSFPEAYRNVAFLANAITSSVNAVKIVRNEDGSLTTEHLPDFLTSQDDWFRPVNMEFGPDGCLYILDWYNKIISHNELPTTHPDRDKAHGRIFRVRYTGAKKREVPNMYEVPTAELVQHLKSPSLWQKRAAWHQISDRPKAETQTLKKELEALIQDTSSDTPTKIAALWSIEGIGDYSEAALNSLLQAQDHNLRREAVRAMNSFMLDFDTIVATIAPLAQDKSPMVRAQVLRTLAESGSINEQALGILIDACKPVLDGNEMGGAYERRFERFLARKALESFPKELLAYMESDKVSGHKGGNLIWAGQALTSPEKERQFLALWKANTPAELDESTFVLIASMLQDPKVYQAMKPVIGNTEKAEAYVSMALARQQEVQSPELSRILSPLVKSLITSESGFDTDLGLSATTKMQIPGVQKTIRNLVDKKRGDEATLKLIMAALAMEGKSNADIFTALASDSDLGMGMRQLALSYLVKTDTGKSNTLARSLLSNADLAQSQKFVRVLSGSKEGGQLLRELYSAKTLGLDAFDISSAERMQKNDPENAQTQAIYEGVKQAMEAEKAQFQQKLDHFMAIAEKGGGDPEAGKPLFQVCLACHSVGNAGQQIAPALDGSAHRENEALLTALLDPDAAMEGSYALYRVTKKDGGTVEGYLSKRDGKGVTIAFMGGSTVFVPEADIKEKGYLGGRSFMPKGLLENYSDTQVADLLAYIKTLK